VIISLGWYKVSLGGVGKAWASSTYDETSMPADTTHLLADVSVSSALTWNQIHLSYNLLTGGDVYVMWQATCTASDACVSTADFKMALTVSFSAVTSGAFPAWSDYVTPGSLPASSFTQTTLDQTTYMSNFMMPCTDSIPTPTRVEVQSLQTDEFWLQSGAGNLGRASGVFGFTSYVDWLPAETSSYLYTSVQTSDPTAKIFLCYNWNYDPAFYALYLQYFGMPVPPLSSLCDYCYPSCGNTTSSGDFITNAVSAQQMQQTYAPSSTLQGVFVSTYVEYGGLVSNTHSTCHAWGHVCSPASVTVPSFAAALFLMVAALM
jgi:hypothetical protein